MGPAGALKSCAMPDPRAELTAQELIYAATALRAEARRPERQAVDPQFESCRALFERSSAAYDRPGGEVHSDRGAREALTI